MVRAHDKLFLLTITMLATAGSVYACAPPERPFMPRSAEDMRSYADLIRRDFEAYFVEIQEYFRCLDAERARAFVEAREVSEEYGWYIETME